MPEGFHANQDYISKIPTPHDEENIFTGQFSTRNLRFEQMLIQGVKDNIPLLPSVFETMNHDTAADFRVLQDHFIGMCHLLSHIAVIESVPAGKAFLISDYYLHQAENCADRSALDRLWLPMYDTFRHNIQVNKKHPRYSRAVSECLEYLEMHLAEPFRMADMAAEVGYHPYYLSSLFKKETGQSAGEYLNSLRIAQSTFYLRFSKISLNEIAAMVGYSHQSAFSAAFKTSMGVSPKEYRKQIII